MQLVDLLWQLLINPNIVYLLLVAGLLCLALALTTPGSGAPEVGAAVFLTLAVLGLFRLPTNLFGLALIVLSFILFMLDFQWTSHGALTVGGIVTLVGGSLMLFGVSDETMRVSFWLIGLTVIVTVAFFTFIVGAALATRHLPPRQNPDSVIGTDGVAKTDVLDEGTVQVGNELWTAESDETIPAGTKVTVVQRNGLKLKVKKR
jgi:membrane-bound serine protease (ClpP class)